MKALLTKVFAPTQRHLSAFFARRAPKSDHVSLGLKNVYVFFSTQGLLFGLLLAITFIMGVNYANNLVLGLCFYLFAVWLIATFYTFVQISALKITLLQTHLTQAGDMAWVDVALDIKSGTPSRQISLQFEGAPAVVVSSVDKEATLRLPVPTQERGRMTLPRLTIQTTYPLGILRAWAYAYFDSPVYVYPKAYPFDYQENTLIAQREGAQMGAVAKTGQDDFDRLDMYQTGESLSRVSWGHLARGAGMLTKHFGDPVSIQRQVAYAQMPSAHHEQKLSQMAFVLSHLQEGELDFEFVLPHLTKTGSGRAFVQACLLELAKTP